MTTIINRRMLNAGLGLFAATALAKGAQAQGVRAQTSAKPPVGPDTAPRGPWTGGGFIQRAGGRLHYATLGTDQAGRPPVVLLHKLSGWLADWRFVAPALAQGRKVIAFDLPGHGDSRWEGPAPYIQTLGETAALLVGAWDEMGIDRVDLIGTSLGGCVAVPLAAFWPERVRKLALVSSALTDKRSLAEIAVKIDEPQKKLFTPAGDPIPFDPALLTKVFGMVHPEQIALEGNASRARAGHWVQCSERGVAITDIRGTLKRVEAQTLLLYGAKDTDYIKFRAGAEAALKHSTTEFVPDAGAFVMQDNPGPTGEILNRFLDRA